MSSLPGIASGKNPITDSIVNSYATTAAGDSSKKNEISQSLQSVKNVANQFYNMPQRNESADLFNALALAGLPDSFRDVPLDRNSQAIRQLLGMIVNNKNALASEDETKLKDVCNEIFNLNTKQPGDKKKLDQEKKLSKSICDLLAKYGDASLKNHINTVIEQSRRAWHHHHEVGENTAQNEHVFNESLAGCHSVLNSRISSLTAPDQSWEMLAQNASFFADTCASIPQTLRYHDATPSQPPVSSDSPFSPVQQQATTDPNSPNLKVLNPNGGDINIHVAGGSATAYGCGAFTHGTSHHAYSDDSAAWAYGSKIISEPSFDAATKAALSNKFLDTLLRCKLVSVTPYPTSRDSQNSVPEHTSSNLVGSKVELLPNDMKLLSAMSDPADKPKFAARDGLPFAGAAETAEIKDIVDFLCDNVSNGTTHGAKGADDIDRVSQLNTAKSAAASVSAGSAESGKVSQRSNTPTNQSGITVEERKKADELLHMIQTPGLYSGNNGDLVADLIFLSHPDTPLEIGDFNEKGEFEILHRSPSDNPSSGPAIRLQLSNEHYSPVIDGKAKGVEKNGDCLYASYLYAKNGVPPTLNEIRTLRKETAEYARDNVKDIVGFLSDNVSNGTTHGAIPEQKESTAQQPAAAPSDFAKTEPTRYTDPTEAIVESPELKQVFDVSAKKPTSNPEDVNSRIAGSRFQQSPSVTGRLKAVETARTTPSKIRLAEQDYVLPQKVSKSLSDKPLVSSKHSVTLTKTKNSNGKDRVYTTERTVDHFSWLKPASKHFSMQHIDPAAAERERAELQREFDARGIKSVKRR